MKKTKVLLSLVLSFLMIFSSVAILAEETTSTASVTFSDVTAGTKTSDAISKLVAHGIMNGYPDGSFKPDGSITRAEVAAVIVRFKKLANDLPADAVTGFSDLDNDASAAWARPYVKAAVDAGIINGFDDGTYRASEPVTYEQLIKMIICAINYDVIASSEKSKLEAMGQTTTWSSGYIAAANRYGITANALMANVTMPASRGTVAVVTSNALNAPVLNIVTDNDGNINYEMGDTTIGEEGRDNLREIDGYVSGTYYTSLTDQAPGISKSELLITSKGEEKTYELSASVQNGLDLEDILGKRVKAYYSELDGQITSLKPSTSSQSAIIKEHEIKSISGDIIRYGKNESVSLDDYIVVYNGKYVDSSTAQTLLESFENGQIELIENGTKKVCKISSYFVGVVKNYESTTKKIYLSYNEQYGGLNYLVYDDDNFVKAYSDGKEVSPESVSFQKGNVINIMEYPDADGNKYGKIYITKKKVTGTVTETNNQARGVVLDGEQYYLTNSYNDYEYVPGGEEKAPFTINAKYTCYLDCTGQIAGADYSMGAGSGHEYGYYIYGDKEGSGSSAIYVATIVTSEGKVESYKVKKSFKLDGESADDSDIVDLDPDQAIRYLKSNGEITSIDTATSMGTRTDDDYIEEVIWKENYTVTSPGSTLKKEGGSTIFEVDNKTLILFVPDSGEETEYTKFERSKIFESGKTFNVSVYDMEGSLSNLVIVYGSNDPTIKFEASSSFMLVTEKGNQTDSTTELIGYVDFGKSPTTKTIWTDDSYKAIDGAIADPNSIGEGDIIRYIEKDGKIISAMVWYDASDPIQEGVVTDDSDPTPQGYATETLKRTQNTGGEGRRYFVYGTAISKGRSDESISVGYFIDDDEVTDKFVKRENCYVEVPVNSSTIYYGKNEDDEFVTLSISSVDIANGDVAGSKVIVIYTGTTSKSVKMIYILD